MGFPVKRMVLDYYIVSGDAIIKYLYLKNEFVISNINAYNGHGVERVGIWC